MTPKVRVSSLGSASAEMEQSLAVTRDPGAAAFFDVDNTVMRGASIFHLARGLASRKFFTAGEMANFAWKQVKFIAAGTEDMEDMAKATEAGLEFAKGRRVEEIVQLGEEIFEEYMVDKLWPGTLAIAQSHLDAGQDVWLVTATPVELAEIIAQRLGLTGAIGTVSEVVDGKYTGKLAGPPMHGQAKADVVARIAHERGYELERCSAYSDSSNDIPMLSLVGNPTAVNPDSSLKEYAREHDWPIRNYRKQRLVVRVGLPAAGVGIGASVAAGFLIARRIRR